MIRVKIVAAYIVLLLVLVLGVFFVVRWDFGSLIEESVDANLRNVAASAEQATKVESDSLHAKARFVASASSLYRAVSGEGSRDEDGNLDVDKQHLQAHEKLKAQHFRLEDMMKGRGAHIASHTPLETGGMPDMFTVTDAKGIGVATLGKDLFSWHKVDVAKQFPIIKEALKGDWEQPKSDFWMWSYKDNDEKRLYEVAIAPLRTSETEAPVGVVILGNMIDDGKAKSKTGLIAGTEDGKDSPRDLAYFRGKQVVASTFDTAKQAELTATLSTLDVAATEPNQVSEIMLGEEAYRATFRTLGTIGDGEPFGLVALRNVSEAKRPMDATLTNIAILGILFLLLGGALLLVLIVRYTRPIEDLEAGIHQVIAGNKDHVFEAVSGHSLQSGLAQALNLMSAYLQGKPMPDDDNPSGGWGDMMGEPSTNQGPAKIQGVALPGMAPPKSSSDEDQG